MWAAPLAFLGVLFYWPLGKIFGLALEPGWSVALANLTEPRTLGIIWFTVWQALLCTLICLVLGVPGAYLLYRKTFRGVGLLRALITVPFVLPVIVVAIGFTAFRNVHVLYSQLGIGWLPDFAGEDFSIYWIVVSQVFVNYAIAVRTIGSAWLTLDTQTEEAAALDGAGRLRTLLQVTLGQLRPALISSAALTFLFCVTSFGLIMVLGGGLIHSIETEIYTAANSFLDLPKASALAMVQILLTVIAFAISSRLTKNSIGFGVIDVEVQRPSIDRRDWPVVALLILVVAPVLILPLALVLVQAFIRSGSPSLQNFVDLAGRGGRDLLDITVSQAISNSLRNALISTALAVVLGLLVSHLLVRLRPGWLRNLFEAYFWLPMGISMVVVGFGYLVTFGGEPFALRSSWLVVPIAQTLVALPLVIRLVYPALLNLPKDITEAAALDGVSSGQLWWLVELPLIRAAVLSAVGFAAVVSIGEFGAASFLAFGDQATLPTVLFRLIARPGAQNYGMAMAASALLIALTFAVVGFIEIRRVQGSKQNAAS